ncbi:lytic transglycosylase domain-containing protein [Paraglaciecola sp.]|uniref:lytic transglycosylase domain-containing protein n=1 Tax=Paraglaciecola sp. TaxID=1920173 RepID=UPI0030F3EBAC
MLDKRYANLAKPLLGVLLLWSFCLTSQASGLTQLDIKNILIDEALEQGIDPSLALAIAKVESDFNPTALSHAGAKGVMQIMPATARNGFNVASHDLYKAEVNVRVGVAFIKQLLKQYQGDVDIALSHYNGGSAVKRSNGELRIIPATRHYVSKVRDYAQRYRREGYDDTSFGQQNGIIKRQHVSTKPQNAIYARSTIKPQRTLSYAQQIAQDEDTYDWQNPRIIAARLNERVNERPNNEINLEANLIVNEQTDKPRIDSLQQLREHNLTRTLTANKSQPFVPDNAQLALKKQKVASWEAIFN